MEDSPIGLDKWLTAMWQVVNCKNDISSLEVHRALGIAQKTAWFLDHRIRFALGMPEPGKASGNAEADETFIGGKARNMHIAQRTRRITGTGAKDKTAVIGILERGKNGEPRKVRTAVIPNRKKEAVNLKSINMCRPVPRCTLISFWLEGKYAHKVVDHAVEYVNGNVHTNGLETFGRCLSAASTEPTFRSSHSICSGIWTNKHTNLTIAI